MSADIGHPAGSRARIGVLASGGGSNLGALLAHFDQPSARRVGHVVCVASDRADAGALERAHARGIGADVIADPRDGAAIRALLHAHDVDLVVLAGYLKLLPADVVQAWPGRVVNVHPALLPAFGGPGMYGSRVHAAVVASGARLSGATVHFVNEEYDRGAIIAQWPVPVFPADTPADVAARVLRVEHRLLPCVVEAIAAGDVALLPDGTVRGFVALSPSAAPRADEFSLPSDLH